MEQEEPDVCQRSRDRSECDPHYLEAKSKRSRDCTSPPPKMGVLLWLLSQHNVYSANSLLEFRNITIIIIRS